MADEPRERAGKGGIHLLLFVATCATTFLSGAGVGSDFDAENGIYFSATLMGILLCHEFGHYFVARLHGVPASLPYFIPLPPVVSLGTLGAVIAMEESITDRNKLIDVGAAGPIAGLLVAVPLLLVGLSLSTIEPISTDPDTMLEGNSLAYLGLKYAVYGLWLPTDSGLDVTLHPMAFAAWVGLLITMINLLPVGQLDGGHVFCAALGEHYERFSGWVHRGMLLVSVGVAIYVYFLARASELSTGPAIWAGGKAAMPWLVWSALLLYMRNRGERYHPPVSPKPLQSSRKALFALVCVILALLFTPIPLREAM